MKRSTEENIHYETHLEKYLHLINPPPPPLITNNEKDTIVQRPNL
jgi:hypothetical protein